MDLLEVCCPWDSPLSAAVIRAGGRAFRMGIHNGYDLSTKAGLAKAVRKLKELRPRYLDVSPPCFPWSTATNGALGNPAMLAKLHQNRQHGRKVLKGCAKLIEIQRQELNGQTSMCSESSAGHAGGEHPLCALSWKEPSVRRMVSLCGGEKFRVDGCRYGMYSKRGQGPIQKPWGWFSSSEAVRKAIQKRCQHGSGEHVSMNSRKKVASATYPPKLCRTLAKAIMGELFVELRNKVHVYVQDEYRENAKRRKTNPEVPVNEPPEFDGNLFPDVEPADTEAPENQQPLEPEDPINIRRVVLMLMLRGPVGNPIASRTSCESYMLIWDTLPIKCL